MRQDEAVATITKRLIEYLRPERIYLFGSAARGDSGPDSDLDCCVVLPDDAPSNSQAGRASGPLGCWYSR